jgi:DNA polymerase-3 subunit alpha
MRIFKIEDYSGGMEMLLMGEDFVRFGNYIEMGRFLHIKGKVQNRWRNEDQFEFKPQSISLLTELREKLCKQISIKIDISQLTPPFVEDLYQTFESHPGKCKLSIYVSDPENRMEIQMMSRALTVAPENSLLKALEQDYGLKVSLN